METLKRPSRLLILLCKTYKLYVMNHADSDERAEAHNLMMDQMTDEGYVFSDRDDSRALCMYLIQLDELWDFVEEHTKSLTNE